jgi:hypothetical protein
MRDRVSTQCSMTASSDISAVLPVAVPRGGASRRGCLDARGRAGNGESLSRARCLEREQVTCSLVLLGCGILFGLFVGSFVGLKENATPHGGMPCSLEQTATPPPTDKWAAMLSQYHASSGGEPQSVAEIRLVHRPQHLAAATSRVAESSVPAGSVISTGRGAGSVQTGGKRDK